MTPAEAIEAAYMNWLQKDDTAPLSDLLLQTLDHQGYTIVRKDDLPQRSEETTTGD